MDYNLIFDNQTALAVLLSAFIIGGIFKTKKMFLPIFSIISNKIKSKRLALLFVSMASGILPVEGRTSISAPILDSLINHNNLMSRRKMGVLDFVATHHYYMWSPLEKSIIIIMGGLSLTYLDVLSYTIFPLIGYMLYLTYLIFFYINNDDIVHTTFNVNDTHVIKDVINIAPFIAGIGLSMAFPAYYIFPVVALFYIITNLDIRAKELMSFVKWDILGIVFGVIVLANVFKSNSEYLFSILSVDKNTYFSNNSIMVIAVLLLGAAVSFLLGSSSKYAGITVMLTLLLGIKYFPLILMIEYSAYLLSPTHKCSTISVGYFKTKLSHFYKLLSILVIVLLTIGIVQFLTA